MSKAKPTKVKPTKGKSTKGKPTKGKPTKGKPTKGKPTKAKPILPVFAPFVSAVEAELGFLKQDFGLVQDEPSSSPPECVVAYQGDELRVIAYYEYGSRPWLSVSLRAARGGWKEVAVDWLKPAAKTRGESSWSGTADEMKSAVAAQAVALRSLLPGLLRSGQPQIKRALARSQKSDCEAALRLLDGDFSGFPAQDRAYLSSLKASLQACEPSKIQQHLDSELQLGHAFSPSTLRIRGMEQQLAELTIAIQDCLE